MGVVYRTLVIKLRRHVALKVLPQEFVANPERSATARFQKKTPPRSRHAASRADDSWPPTQHQPDSDLRSRAS